MNSAPVLAEVVSPDPALGKLGIFDMRKVAGEVGSANVALIAVGREGELITFFGLNPDKARELAAALLKLAGEEAPAE